MENTTVASTLAGLYAHVQELGKRMKVVIITFFVSAVVMMIIPGNLEFFSNPTGAYEPLVGVLLKGLRVWALPPEVTLIGVGLSDPIELYFQVAIVFALAITMPVLAYHVYRFVDPALRPQERSHAYPFIGGALGLFIGGAAFGFFVLFPLFIKSILPFFDLVGAVPFVSVSDFYGLFLFTTLAAGLLFTFPVWLVLLVKIGLIKTGALTKNRKYLYLLIFILTMIITPGNSPQENVAFFVPLILLFESGILVGKIVEKTRRNS